MSLLETTIAIGVLGVMAVVFATSFSEVFKAQKKIENKDQAAEFARSVSDNLYSQTTCSNGLTGQTIPANPNEEREISIANYSGWGTNGAITLRAGTVMTLSGNADGGDIVRVK
ncbi:MAG: type II secretion system protein, partial [Bdellovibrionales bacterium]|nr:hypothetical protein [Bdellovibrionales bacterium]NQZ18628.1 type II secretion system protein [Bdellovibrionales bacterium]